MQRMQVIRHRQSPDLNQTKITPRTRPTHEAGHDGQLINPNPLLKYVLAPKDEQHPQSYQYYRSIGFELVQCEPGGVRINLGEPPIDGKPLAWRGMFLLSCTRERAEEIFLKGPNGLTGQLYQDKLMDRIKANQLEKRIHVSGTHEEVDIGDLEQNAAPVFR